MQPTPSSSDIITTALIPNTIANEANPILEDELTLNQACEAGDLDRVKKIFQAPDFQIDIDEVNDDNWAPLHFAIRGGNVDLIRYLIDERGADLDTVCASEEGQEVLHFTITDGNLGMVKYIAENGGETMMDAEGESDLRPLHLACLEGHSEIIRYLVEEHKADVNARDDDGWTSMHYTCLYGNLETVRFLVEDYDAETDFAEVDGWTPLHCAATNKGHVDVVRYLLEEQNCDRDALVKKVNQNALHLAASEGSLNVVKYLVEEQGFDVNELSSDGDNSFLLAATYGQLEITRYFIEECCAQDSQARFNMLFATNDYDQNAYDIAARCVENDDEYADADLVDYLKSHVAPLAVSAAGDDEGGACVKLNPELKGEQRNLAEQTYKLIESTEVHEVAHHIMGFLCLTDVRA